MTVLDRSELEASPLADLHAIADQLGLDGFRRLRKERLIDAILGESQDDGGADDNDRAGADGEAAADGDSADGVERDEPDGDTPRSRRLRPRGRGRGRAQARATGGAGEQADGEEPDAGDTAVGERDAAG